jgi:hypothetical protein
MFVCRKDSANPDKYKTKRQKGFHNSALRLTAIAEWQVANGFAKGGLLPSKRPPFTRQKGMFCRLKDGILESR